MSSIFMFFIKILGNLKLNLETTQKLKNNNCFVIYIYVWKKVKILFVNTYTP